MSICYECKKKLRFWEGYRHPTKGKDIIICGECYDKLAESMQKYQSFIITEMKSGNIKSIDNLKKYNVS